MKFKKRDKYEKSLEQILWKFMYHFSKNKNHFLISSFPKSGSTYLVRLLSNYPKMRQVGLVTGYGQREQELSVERLLFYNSKNYVARHHTKFSSTTKNLFSIFNIKPIILVRNIFDTVMSVHDHFCNESTRVPFAFVPEEILNWDKDKSLDFICDMCAPWFLSFFASWESYEKKLLINYEELTQNTEYTMSKVLEYLNLDFNSSITSKFLEKTKSDDTRYNVGKIGRGDMLSDAQKNKIIKLTKYYPDVDFSIILNV